MDARARVSEPCRPILLKRSSSSFAGKIACREDQTEGAPLAANDVGTTTIRGGGASDLHTSPEQLELAVGENLPLAEVHQIAERRRTIALGWSSSEGRTDRLLGPSP